MIHGGLFSFFPTTISHTRPITASFPVQGNMIFKSTLLASVYGLLLTSVTGNPLASRSKTCVVPSRYKSSHGTADDSPAVAKAFADCSSNATIVFSEGVDYNLLHPINATNLSNVQISMLGNLHLPKSIEAIQ